METLNAVGFPLIIQLALRNNPYGKLGLIEHDLISPTVDGLIEEIATPFANLYSVIA